MSTALWKNAEPDGEFMIKVMEEQAGKDRMITKLVVVFETVDMNGERHLGWAYSRGVKRWDMYGMLEQMSNVQIAAEVKDELENNENDEEE